MPTQFMIPPQMSYATQPPYYQAPLQHGAKGFSNGGFAFRKRFERVDWRKMASVDVEQISRTLDFNALQENIMNITFCSIEAELDVRSVDPNFLKLFKLAQLTIEYLLYSQEYLAGLCTTLEEKSKARDEAQEKVREELEAVKRELAEVKRESHKRKKLLIAQQQLMHAGNGAYNKCPLCPKAFLNASYLQAHVQRRHGSGSNSSGFIIGYQRGSGDSSKALSPDQGVGDSLLAHNPQLEAEFMQMKERLKATEAQLEEANRGLASIRRKENQIVPMVEDKVEAATAQQSQVYKEELEKVKKVFKRELREANEKYQASERALAELEQRYGAKRSYLGASLQDDVDNDVEMLKQQRAEVAELHEELQRQMDRGDDPSQEPLSTHHRRSHRARNKDRRSRQRDAEERQAAMEEQVAPLALQQEAEAAVQPVSVEMMARQQGVSMYPSDDDDNTFGLGTGTSSLKTPGRTPQGNSTLGSTLGMTGSGPMDLRTSQFLEQLRQNPTLGIMRGQLAELLGEKVDKCGIPHGAPGISLHTLDSKLAMQATHRKTYLQRYPNFNELRDYFNREAETRALKRLRQRNKSPRGAEGPIAASYLTPQAHTGKSPRPPQPYQAPPSRSSSSGPPPRGGASHSRGPMTDTQRSSSAPSPRPRPQAPPTSTPQPQAQPRSASPNKTPLSTGSTTELTTTPWESEDDSDDNNISGVKPFSPSPKARLIQSGPRPSPRHTPSPKPSPRHQVRSTLIQSRPLHPAQDDDIEEILASDREDEPRSRPPAARLSSSAPPGKGQKVSVLARNIQKQLGSRSLEKPAGAVDTMSSTGAMKNQEFLEDFDDASDWDDEPAPPPARGGGRKSGPGSTDYSSNTYGTSQWGTNSKGAGGAAKHDAKRSVSRSSFVSVTDLSSDDDMNVDNI